MLRGNPALLQAKFLKTAHIPARFLLDFLNGLSRGEQAVRSACIQPSKVFFQRNHLKLSPAEVLQVDVGDFQLAPRGGF